MENVQNDCCRCWAQKYFQEFVFKTFKNRKRNGCVNSVINSSSDQLTEIYFSSNYSHLFLGDDDNYECIQQRQSKGIELIFFRSISLVFFTAELDE